jgi:hypothetical protein
MASGALDQEGRFIAVGHGFYGIFLGSWVFFLILGRS